jgi:aspartyl-tRNA(Asn)/glutamyl-tRNA(Gln) amidotransferase subunit A
MTDKTASEWALLLNRRALSAVDLARALLEQADRLNPAFNAFTKLEPETILKQAEASDTRRRRGDLRGPLDGIPVAIKDAIAVAGEPLTCGSRILEHFVSPYDAHAIEKLRAAGAVLFGRTNMDEFAMGSSTESSFFGPTRNPWDAERVPGGSSGGSAAALAARMVPLALGSDTGGSIRQPASFCGVSGLKPTYGRVSRYGLVAYASSLEQIGPMARSVADTALLLRAIAGPDKRDSTCLPHPVPDYASALQSAKARPATLGLPSEYFSDGLDPQVHAVIEKAAQFYETNGCTIRKISLPSLRYAIPAYYLIATAEASSNLARYDGVRYARRAETCADAVDLYFQSRAEGFGSEVKRRCLLGAHALSSGYYDAYYLRAQKVRRLIANDFQAAFESVDALLAPVCPTPAFRLGEKTADPLAMYLADIYTLSPNLAGLPALSLPAGFTTDGLPVGLQLIGPAFGEERLLQLGSFFEQAHDFHRRTPAGIA